MRYSLRCIEVIDDWYVNNQGESGSFSQDGDYLYIALLSYIQISEQRHNVRRITYLAQSRLEDRKFQ